MGNGAECRLAELTGFVRRKLADRSQRHASGWRVPAAASAVFDDVGLFAGRLHAQPEAFQVAVPNEILAIGCPERVHTPFRDRFPAHILPL